MQKNIYVVIRENDVRDEDTKIFIDMIATSARVAVNRADEIAKERNLQTVAHSIYGDNVIWAASDDPTYRRRESRAVYVMKVQPNVIIDLG